MTRTRSWMVLAGVAALAASTWPWVLYFLTSGWRVWHLGDFGAVPLLLMMSGFTGSLVFTLLLWWRAGWDKGVCFSVLTGISACTWLVFHQGGLRSLRVTQILVLLTFLVYVVMGGMAGSGLACLIKRGRALGSVGPEP